MNDPVIYSSTLTDEQREKIRNKFKDIKRWYEYYDGAGLYLDSNFHGGWLEAFEYIFGKDMFE